MKKIKFLEVTSENVIQRTRKYIDNSSFEKVAEFKNPGNILGIQITPTRKFHPELAQETE